MLRPQPTRLTLKPEDFLKEYEAAKSKWMSPRDKKFEETDKKYSDRRNIAHARIGLTFDRNGD